MCRMKVRPSLAVLVTLKEESPVIQAFDTNSCGCLQLYDTSFHTIFHCYFGRLETIIFHGQSPPSGNQTHPPNQLGQKSRLAKTQLVKAAILGAGSHLGVGLLNLGFFAVHRIKFLRVLLIRKHIHCNLPLGGQLFAYLYEPQEMFHIQRRPSSTSCPHIAPARSSRRSAGCRQREEPRLRPQ